MTRCQWCKADIGDAASATSVVGTYVDGRPVRFAAATHSLDVGGTPVGLDDMRAYDAASQIKWTSDDARRLALHAYDGSPLSSLEWVIFTVAFVALPGFSGILGTVFYLAWNKSQPVKARQLLRLGWIIFAMAVVVIGVLDYTHLLPGT